MLKKVSVVQRNGYFAQQDCALIAMLGDDNENVRNVGVAKMLESWKQVVEKSENNDDCPLALDSSLIRLFNVPTLILEANAYHEFANFDSYQQKPKTIASLALLHNAHTEIKQRLKKPLVLHYPHVIANLWSGTSNLLRKCLHKLKVLINNERSHSTKTLNLANVQKRLTPKSSSNKVL